MSPTIRRALKVSLVVGTILNLINSGDSLLRGSLPASPWKIPLHLQHDPHLWSGCISGAYTEEGFLKAFEEAGFHGIEILKRDDAPWQTVEGIEFRSVTIQAWKGKQGPCFERNQAVIYKGPFLKVLDDDGHALERGKRYAVCDKTFQLYQQAPRPLSSRRNFPLTT